MEFVYKKGEIIYPRRKLTVLDKLVLDFLSYVDVNYVIVSGYVAILFGRDRHTEDVDMFIEHIEKERFLKLFKKITASGKYYCINTDDVNDAYDILEKHSSIRFAESGTFDPNFEIKFPQNELNRYSLKNVIKVKIDDNPEIRIGPLELQLAYKLYLGSDKDYEDAAHTYIIFKNSINKQELKRFLEKLHIKASIVKKVLGEEI